jgi:hypothetical protein
MNCHFESHPQNISHATVGTLPSLMMLTAIVSAVAGAVDPVHALAISRLATFILGIELACGLLMAVLSSAAHGYPISRYVDTLWLPIATTIAFGLTLPLADGTSGGQLLVNALWKYVQ